LIATVVETRVPRPAAAAAPCPGWQKIGMAKLLKQYAALAVMGSGEDPQVLLVTSRGTGRWIIPKGHPEKGMKPSAVARLEALEEGGVGGTISETPLGRYRSTKRGGSGKLLPCEVVVFQLRVSEHLSNWKEEQQRRRLWVPLAQAEKMVDDGELAAFMARVCTERLLSRPETCRPASR
jgi:8-oxo-dGTP pyrophosphatase MutT (NUDIX family)